MAILFWFRRDLRAEWNEALKVAYSKGARRAVFIETPGQWNLHDMADIQRDLLERRVNFLSEKLAGCGVRLDILHADLFSDVPDLLKRHCEAHGVDKVYLNCEYEINETRRDAACEEKLSGVAEFFRYHGDLIAPPGSVLTGSGGMYKVFTPFKNAWVKAFSSEVFTPTPSTHSVFKTTSEKGQNDVFRRYTTPSNPSKAWPVDDISVSSRIQAFVEEKLQGYHDDRDFPNKEGTSKMSPYLALGIVGPAQLVAALQEAHPRILKKNGDDVFTFVTELIWREFYRHLVVSWPKLCMGKNFTDRYDSVEWCEEEGKFEAWCEGRTGYPIVDAAMRGLKAEGWMHNRLRMVVASFLVKHLLVDWRKGEKHFMKHLIDGDLPSNNGGWQWAASTGCDSQPYFRIFNPTLQSQRFDPTGGFIKAHLPTLATVPAKHIHNPHAYLASHGKTDLYWPQIVDHKTAREKAISVFKNAAYGEDTLPEKTTGTKRKRETKK